MNVEATFKIRGVLDIDKMFENIEKEGGNHREIQYSQGHSIYELEILELKGVTIQLFPPKTLNVYYDDYVYSIQDIQECLHRFLVDSEGKPVELILKGENRKVKQKVGGIIGLVSEPLKMVSPRGDIISVMIRSGTITGSILPAGSTVWEPLEYLQSIGTICSGTVSTIRYRTGDII